MRNCDGESSEYREGHISKLGLRQVGVRCDFCAESGNLLRTLFYSLAASGGWQEPENPHTQRVSEGEGHP